MRLKMIVMAAVGGHGLDAAFCGQRVGATLSVDGVTQSGKVSITASLASGSSTVLRTAGGLFINTCTAAHMSGQTSVTSGLRVRAPLASL